jgi:hypothetical protein
VGVVAADAGRGRRNLLEVVVRDHVRLHVAGVDDSLGARFLLQAEDFQKLPGHRLVAKPGGFDVFRAFENRIDAVRALFEPVFRRAKSRPVDELRQGRRRAEFPAAQLDVDRWHGKVVS